MIHPNLATMLAVVTTDYPLEPGEAARLPAARGRRELQLDLGRRRVLDERRGRPALERRERRQRTRRRRSVRRGAARRLRRPRAADRRRRRGRDRRRARSTSRGAATDGEAKAVARRIATSPLVKTALFGKDANWGRVLAAAGSAPFNGGYAHLDPSLVTLCYNGAKVLDRGAPQRRRARRRRADTARSTSTSASATAARTTSPPTCPTTTSASTRTTAREPDRRQVRRRGRGERRRADPRARRDRAVVVVHGAGPQISAEMERRGLEVQFVGGTARDEQGGARGRARVDARGQRRSVRRDRRPRASASSATRSACARCRCRCSAWSATRAVRARRRRRRARRGLIPVVAPLAAGPLNVNADEMAAALAVGLEAERILFVTDVPGLLDGGVVSR